MFEENKAIIRRYYADHWNRWDLSVADDIIAPDIAFRGSLGLTAVGIDGFKGYVATVRAAFPDFHNSIEDLVAEGDKVAVRLAYRGTHRGEVFGAPPTGRPVAYPGIAIFRISGGKITDAWIMGDTWSLRQQLGMLPGLGRAG